MSQVITVFNSLYIKGFWAICIVFGIIGIFGWNTVHFNTNDEIPSLIIIDAAKQKEFGAFTVKVKTGLFIKNFPNFDIIRNTFLIDCLVWFELYPDEIMLNMVEKFSFNNGRIVHRSSPDIKIDQGKMIVTYDVRVECKSNMRYDRFPFEDHRITLMITNAYVTPSEMFFEVTENAFKIAPNIFISNWRVKDYATDAGYMISKLEEQDDLKEQSYPIALFTINFQKSGIRKILIIFLPLFFAIFFSFLSLFMNAKNNFGRYSASISGVTSLIGYRFVIEQMMPDVGYFTLADSLYILLLSIAFIIFIFQIFFTRYIEKIHVKEEEEIVDIVWLYSINSFVFFVLSSLLLLLVIMALR